MTIWAPVWTPIGNNEGYVVQWGPMLQGDTATAVTEGSYITGFADRSVQVEGTFGAAGNINIVGSNDAANFEILNDPSSTPLQFTSAKIKGILEAVRQIKPMVTGGDGTTSLTVSILFRKLR